MQSKKFPIGVLVLIVFLVGAGFILVRYGAKSNDGSSNDSGNQVTTDVPINTVPVAVTPVAPVAATPTVTNPTPVATKPKSTPVTPVKTSAYADGTYSATGSYNSPAGIEKVGVSVTIKNGIVQSSTVTNEANDGTSRRYQNMFISGYKTYVTGKNVASISVGKVSGSSLTGAGFNQALAKIKSQAAAA